MNSHVVRHAQLSVSGFRMDSIQRLDQMLTYNLSVLNSLQPADVVRAEKGKGGGESQA